MQISKNKKHQYLFFGIIFFYCIFNGGNSDLIIQLNFIFISLFYILCLNDKNYFLHQRSFFIKNKFFLILFSLFVIYIIFQIVPLQVEILKIFSKEKYKYIVNLHENISYSSISLSPSKTFFQILNVISLFLIVCILRMIFYTEKHIRRLYIFLSFIGFSSSLFAIILFLYGNPDIMFVKNSFYKASTGFFINRTVFAIFLLFCLISGLELLKNLSNNKQNNKKDNFFLKIYIRLFILFITIGIITSFSRIGNFLLLITILIYLLNDIFFEQTEKKSFRYIILFIVFFDIVILGFYFGTSELVDRFSILNEEFASLNNNKINITRLQIIKFSFEKIQNFFLFGYGLGSYETMFQLEYINSLNNFANHAHSDVLEFFGELGLIGFILLLASIIKCFLVTKHNHIFFILMCSLATLLLFDFSLHIPIIQILFIIFFVTNLKIIHSN